VEQKPAYDHTHPLPDSDLARAGGTAMVGIFHYPEDRNDLSARTVDIPLQNNGA